MRAGSGEDFCDAGMLAAEALSLDEGAHQRRDDRIDDHGNDRALQDFTLAV